jgi:hypothetical protein
MRREESGAEVRLETDKSGQTYLAQAIMRDVVTDAEPDWSVPTAFWLTGCVALPADWDGGLSPRVHGGNQNISGCYGGGMRV